MADYIDTFKRSVLFIQAAEGIFVAKIRKLQICNKFLYYTFYTLRYSSSLIR